MAFALDRIDHIVLNCSDLERTIAWYQRVLGMKAERYNGDRTALLSRQSLRLRDG